MSPWARGTIRHQANLSTPFSEKHLPDEIHSRYTFRDSKSAPQLPTKTGSRVRPQTLGTFMAQAKPTCHRIHQPKAKNIKRTTESKDMNHSVSAEETDGPPPPKKKRRSARRLYDDPSATQYPASEYPPVPDHLFPSEPNRRLDLLVCGMNPGLMSSQHGAHFRHPSNHFYRTLHLGNLTPNRVDPLNCVEMLDQKEPWPSIGLTNICIRPTAEGGELGKQDYMEGTPILEHKIRLEAKPRLMVFTGKGIGAWWQKCCEEMGALTKQSSQAARCKSQLQRAAETIQSSRSHVSPRHVSLPVPQSIAWAQDESDGLGLLPFLIELKHPLTRGDPASAGTLPSTKLDDGSRDEKHGVALRDRYCFIFVTTSPSGRVTTMHLPEKAKWMAKVRDTLDWLKGPPGPQFDMVMRAFQVVDASRIQRSHESTTA